MLREMSIDEARRMLKAFDQEIPNWDVWEYKNAFDKEKSKC